MGPGAMGQAHGASRPASGWQLARTGRPGGGRACEGRDAVGGRAAVAETPSKNCDPSDETHPHSLLLNRFIMARGHL